MNIKKLLAIFMVLTCTMSMFAVPARKGLWRILTLKDGTTVQATLTGDEHLHYYLTADRVAYNIGADGIAYPIHDLNALRKGVKKRMQRVHAYRQQRIAAKKRTPDKLFFDGHKKGLIIMVQFADKKFKLQHDNAFINRMVNKVGFNELKGFKGSVHDYFYAQSNGTFNLTFDVVGPVTLPKPYKYYGENKGEYNEDKGAGEMVAEACKAIVDKVNFKDYDWNGDGEVDQVYVLYAGKGEANGGDEFTIWPHEYQLKYSDYGQVLTLDNTRINTYGCSCELNDREEIDGLGTICHEFSHCLGFPDMYDTDKQKNYGMSSWDLMDYGSYNGNGRIPAGYTSYEKWCAGWLEPIMLERDTVVKNLKPLSMGGQAYVIYNDNHPYEYYLIENRQKKGWDQNLYGQGMLILHVDYNENKWWENTVNVDPKRQRCTIFHADGSDKNDTYEEIANDAYPYKNNNKLTSTSRPKATLYNPNVDGSMLMKKDITDITQNADGTVSFKFLTKAGKQDNSTVEPQGDVFFYESFNLCDGTGGNDNQFAGRVGNAAFLPDHPDWSTLDNKCYGADKCAKFGTTKVSGITTSPRFKTEGVCRLTFKIAPWATESGTVTITLSNKDMKLSKNVFELKSGQWTECEATITGSGMTNITFTPSVKRFFLDEVLVKKPGGTQGITEIQAPESNKKSPIYGIDGRYMGTDLESLGKGIYIINGKKIIK